MFHGFLLFLFIEDMPSVEVPMFSFCDQSKIVEAIVKSVMIDVVNLHPTWCLCDKPVHPDQVIFAGNPFAESSVTEIAGRDITPGKLFEEVVKVSVDKTDQSPGKED